MPEKKEEIDPEVAREILKYLKEINARRALLDKLVGKIPPGAVDKMTGGLRKLIEDGGKTLGNAAKIAERINKEAGKKK